MPGKQKMNIDKKWNCLRLVLTAVIAVVLYHSVAMGQDNHWYPQEISAPQQYVSPNPIGQGDSDFPQMKSVQEQFVHQQPAVHQQPVAQNYGNYPQANPVPQEQIIHQQPIGQTYTHYPQQEFGTTQQFVSQNLMGHAAPRSNTPEHTKILCGVDQYSGAGRNPRWSDSRLIPWENYSFGEYIGPSRTPHVPAYRLRVDDQIEFVFQVTRETLGRGYRLSAGDTIRVTSPVDEKLNETSRELGITIMPDNTISLDLIGTVVAGGKTVAALKAELDMLYSRFFNTDPSVVVAGIQTGTRLRDFLDSVDARAGSGGQSRTATVNPDGTVRLPLAGTIGVVGLSLDELEREINMRYAQHLQGLRVTPILATRAPRFIYVTGEVPQPGRFELTAPTSTMQAIALAGGWNTGGNLRQIVVFRRDKDWRLMAIKLDLQGGLFGKQPIPSDEIWLRDSDIVLIPKTPILRLADAIELYFSRTLYGIFPSELGSFDAQAIGGIGQ